MKYYLNSFIAYIFFLSAAQAQKKEVENVIPKPNFVTKEVTPFVMSDYPWQLSPYTQSVALKKIHALKEEVKAVRTLLSQSKDKQAVSRILKTLRRPLAEADRQSKAELYRLLGDFCLRYSVYDESERYFKIALAERIIAPDFTGYGGIAQQLAEVNLKKGQVAEALKYNNVALTEYMKARKIDSLASCYFQLAKINYVAGERGEAEFILVKKALPLFTYVENSNGRMRCFKEIGRICLEQGRYSEAKWFSIQHNILAKIQGDKTEIFNSVVGLAKSKTAVKDFKIAWEDLKEAQRRLNSLGDNPTAKLNLREAYKFYYARKGNKTETEMHNRKIIELKQVINKSKLNNNKTAVDILNTSKNKSDKIAYIAALTF